MERVEELKRLKELLQEWGMDEEKAKIQALKLVYGAALPSSSTFVQSQEPQSEQ